MSSRHRHLDLDPTPLVCAFLLALGLSIPAPWAPPVLAAEAPETAPSPTPSSIPSTDSSADPLREQVARMARIGSCGSPSFSPDGEELAVVCDLSGVPQVWRVPVEGGWPVRVTPFEDQVGGVDWSPGGDRLAVSVAPGGGLNQQIYLLSPDGTGVTRITAGGRTNNWLGSWSRDGRYLGFSSNLRTPAAMDAYLWDSTTGEARRVAENPGIGYLSDMDRSDHRVSLGRIRGRGDVDVYLVDSETGSETLLTPHDGPANVGGGRFAPDGRAIYLSSNIGRDRSALVRLPLDPDGHPGRPEILAARADADVDAFAITDDGRTAALVWNVAGRSELELLDLVTGEPLPTPELPAEIAGAPTFSRDGARLAITLSGAARPRDVWVLDRAPGQPGTEPGTRRGAGGVWRQVTHSPHAGVDLSSLVQPELVRYQAQDGLELTGWLYRPPGATGPAPYVLSFHGGPEGQERPGFRSDYQALLKRGIGVFAPNVRGSAGFGKRFLHLDDREKRFDGIRDIEATARYLVQAGLADPDRLGIVGGSYGGYMVMAGLTEYPNLFAAGANLFGVVNFETFFEQTEPWMAAISTTEYGDPETQRDLLRRLSPIHKVDRVVAPTLVLHGANDTNVPVVEAQQVVESLEQRGVPVKYVLFPDEGHGFRKTKNRITSTVEIVRWFETHLAHSSMQSGTTETFR
jgi:dipeptidyl aminopeptidase/acylaminoacyl peptidase